MYCWRSSLNFVSIALGGEASTIGRAGDIMRPPTVTDRGGGAVAILMGWLVLSILCFTIARVV